METMIFNDNTELQIKEGASISNVTFECNDFTALGMAAEQIQKTGNLDIVTFKTNDSVSGNYTDLKLTRPLFTEVDVLDSGKLRATFGMREKTEIEKAIEELRKGQELQDGAISDLGEVVSTIAEGGAV